MTWTEFKMKMTDLGVMENDEMCVGTFEDSIEEDRLIIDKLTIDRRLGHIIVWPEYSVQSEFSKDFEG